MSKPRLIAFYLPQFYPTKENNEWWEPGFTEWTNVAKAKPLFRGHYQPRIPRDLGFYDLRVPETREHQVQLAKEAGIEGFCYWHYWFAGRRLLDRVFNEVVESGKPDFPFCLCWANHSWYQKTWNPSKPDKLLIEQTYPGEDDFVAHFYALLPAFKDNRYLKKDGKLLFGIFAPHDFRDFKVFKEIWNKLAIENGLNGFYFIGYISDYRKLNSTINNEYDGIVYDGLLYCVNKESFIVHYYRAIKNRLLRRPRRCVLYKDYVKSMLSIINLNRKIFPCIDPNFDHTPRSARRAFLLKDSTPKNWEMFCKKVFALRSSIRHEDNLVFVKAWNEWGEGNYMEPDLKYGKGYIEALANAVSKFDEE